MSSFTSYQGDKRQFGFFFCKNCKRSWQSGNSWTNTGQMCKTCNIMVHPFKQQPLERSTSNNDNNVPHPQHLCGKCKKLGYACNLRYYE